MAGKTDWFDIFYTTPDLQPLVRWDLYYLTCLHDNLVTVLRWMNEEMPKWLAPIDPFDKVCAEIRKEMGWK